MSNSDLKREIGFFSATILVIANMVGTGIFTTSGFIIEEHGDPQILGVNIVAISPQGVVAIGVIIIFSLFHYHSLLMGSRIQNALTAFKVGIVVVFVVAGLFLGHGSTGNFSGGLAVGSVFQDKFAISLIFVSFAYSGWNAAAYIGGEIKRLGRNIPLDLL